MAISSSLATGLERATLVGPKDTLSLTLNPKSLSIRRQSQWQVSPNRGPNAAQPSSATRTQVPLGHGTQQFRGSQPGTLTMTVWFDQSFEPSGDITNDVHVLQNWTCPSEVVSSGAQNPPRITFTWGTLIFVGHIASLTVTYKQFGSAGQPIRAEAQITITENPMAKPGNNPTSGGISGRRIHVVSAGDSLQSISWSEYGNAAMWRALAEANGIDDPLRVNPGTSLLIPPTPERTGLQ